MFNALKMSDSSARSMWLTLRLAVFSACWIGLPLAANADWGDDIGLTKLQNTLGD
jgi:hypothetical protein